MQETLLLSCFVSDTRAPNVAEEILSPVPAVQTGKFGAGGRLSRVFSAGGVAVEATL